MLAYANGFTHWHYRTRDCLDQILAPAGAGTANDNAYFAAAAEMLRPGDQITVNLIGVDHIGLATLVAATITQGAGPLMLLVSTSGDQSPAGRVAA
ncbi:MAG: hypothetical protein IPK59_12040 [Rhodospirillaceae bacterium]|nr:hypothetical protein [Rhodospirillaceae bacterium]